MTRILAQSGVRMSLSAGAFSMGLLLSSMAHAVEPSKDAEAQRATHRASPAKAQRKPIKPPVSQGTQAPRPQLVSDKTPFETFQRTAMPDSHLPLSLDIAAGRANVLSLPFKARRVAVGNPMVADFTWVSSQELYVLGKSVGTTNLIIWDRQGEAKIINLTVGANLGAFSEVLAKVLPHEKDIKLSSASGSIVLSGGVSDAIAADAAISLAHAFLREALPNPTGTNPSGTNPATAGGLQTAALNTAVGQPVGAISGPAYTPIATQTGLPPGANTAQRAQVINLMRIRDAQQVMLDVKIAEISKTLLEKLGVKGVQRDGLMRWDIISNFVGGASNGSLGILLGQGTAAGTGTMLEAAKNDGLVKILAEPTIVAMSGHEGKFLVGGKVFVPVTQNTGTGSAVTLDEREFGVGLRFVPTVLDAGRVSLRVASEVSEISKEPLVLASGTTNAILPTITTRNVSTTVQLRESQSLVIGGLLRNNITESVKAFPLLGEIPILGALFRSTEFNSEQTELVVVVSPRMVVATDRPPPMPTNAFTPPSRAQLHLEGKMEGGPPGNSTGEKK